MPDLMDYHLDASGLPEEFEAAMRNVYEQSKAKAGYTATQFLQTINNYGGLEAAYQLLQKENTEESVRAMEETLSESQHGTHDS